MFKWEGCFDAIIRTMQQSWKGESVQQSRDYTGWWHSTKHYMLWRLRTTKNVMNCVLLQSFVVFLSIFTILSKLDILKNMTYKLISVQNNEASYPGQDWFVRPQARSTRQNQPRFWKHSASLKWPDAFQAAPIISKTHGPGQDECCAQVQGWPISSRVELVFWF